MAGRLNTTKLTEQARKEVWTRLLSEMPKEEAIIASTHVMENERYLAAARLGWLHTIADELNSTASDLDLDPEFVTELRESMQPVKPVKNTKPAIALVHSA